MKYQIVSLEKFGENQMKIRAEAEQGLAVVTVPYSYSKGTKLTSKLLVTIDRPGFVGWLIRKLIR